MSDIVEFLRARYADQLAAMDSWISKRRTEAFSRVEMMVHTTVTDLIPSNPLALYEVDAVNQRVAEIQSNLLILDEHSMCWPCQTLRLLALPYTRHSDYREEWRP